MEEQLLEILDSSLTNKPLWALLVAFAGGLISSLSPCVLSILPIIMGYVGGYSEGKISKAFLQSLLFALGLTIVLTIIGIIAALAGIAMGSLIGPFWFIILGIVAIIMGLSLMEFFYIPFPAFIKDMPTQNYGKILSPIILGMAFGIIATPCSTPILITLVTYVASEKSIPFGILLLLTYAFGHSILLIIVGTFTGLIKEVGKLRKWTSYITKISGILLIIIGLYFLISGIQHQFFPL